MLVSLDVQIFFQQSAHGALLTVRQSVKGVPGKTNIHVCCPLAPSMGLAPFSRLPSQSNAPMLRQRFQNFYTSKQYELGVFAVESFMC